MATFTLDEFEARLRRFGAGGLRSAILRLATRGALEAQGAAREFATTRLRVRTGRLRASITGTAAATADGAEIRLRAGGRGSAGKDVPYARIHEYGGVVVAKNKALRIPLGPARTGAGVDRFPGPLLTTAPGLFARIPPRGVPAVLVYKGPKGSPFRAGRGKAWYALVDHVTIPARPYLHPALDQTAERVIRPALADVLRAELLGEGGR